jgi:hypothetical protein
MLSYNNIKDTFKSFNEKPRSLLEAIEFNSKKNMLDQAQQLAMRQQQQSVRDSDANYDFNQQRNPELIRQQKLQNMSDTDKFEMENMVRTVSEIEPFVQNQDADNVIRTLQRHRQDYAQKGLDTSDLDEGIRLAGMGDFETLNTQITAIKRGSQALGYGAERPQSHQGGGTGYIIEKLMADNPELSYAQALAMVQGSDVRGGIMRQGDGTLSPVAGFNENRYGIKNAEERGKTAAQLPYQQKLSEIETDAQKQRHINKLHQDYEYYKSISDIDNMRAIEKEIRNAETDINVYRQKSNINIAEQNRIGQDRSNQELTQKQNVRLQDLKNNLPMAETVTINSIMGIDDTVNKLENVKKMINPATAGWGSLLSSIPASDAGDLEAQLMTVNSRFGLDQLLALKNKGGTLGQIAVKEFEALQSSVANLKQSQSADQLKRNLDDAIKQSRKAQDFIEKAFVAEYGDVLNDDDNQPQAQEQPKQNNGFEFLGYE